ncbi:MAG: DMT family transporter [Actinomycetota bacterium]
MSRRHHAQLARSVEANGFLLVTLAAAMWGSDALFRRGLALELPASVVVFAEHAILVVATAPLVVSARGAVRGFSRKDWLALAFVGVGASATATILFTEAFTYGDPTTPLLLQKLQPLFAIAGAAILLGERLLPRYVLYFFSGLGGAYLITFPEPLHVSVDEFVPAALATGAAALWGLGTVLGRHLTSKVEFKQLTALRFAVGLPAAAVIMWVQGDAASMGAIDARAGLALLLLALIPGLLALLIYYRGLHRTPAAAATLGELAFPLSAVAINYIAFGTTLGGTQWLGIALLSVTIALMGLASSRGGAALGVELRRPLPSPLPSSVQR